MTNLPSLMATIVIFFSFVTTLIISSSARTLNPNNTPTHNPNHKITFLMPYVLNTTTTQVSPKPSSKPLGIFSPTKGIPVPQYSTQTLDLSTVGFSFPARATLEELELGKVTLIDQELVEEFDKGKEGDELRRAGRARGVYVARSEVGSDHVIMAMTASFGYAYDNEDGDGVRLFGVQRSDVFESHVAVIGGTGKYEGANGYAAVRVVDRVGFRKEGKGKVMSDNKFLLFDVYLS